jgi:hypothetical protein
MSEKPEKFSDDRRAHLVMIQATIARMASSSSSAKTWLLPVVTAAYAFALVQGVASVGVLGLGAVVMFAIMDARYLRLERAYRALYNSAVQDRAELFDMNVSRFFDRTNGDPEDLQAVNSEWHQIVWSWSIAGFYLPLFIAGAGSLAWVSVR